MRRTVTDDELVRMLRARTNKPVPNSLAEALVASVRAEPARIRRSDRRRPFGRPALLLAATVATVAVASALVAGGGRRDAPSPSGGPVVVGPSASIALGTTSPERSATSPVSSDPVSDVYLDWQPISINPAAKGSHGTTVAGLVEFRGGYVVIGTDHPARPFEAVAVEWTSSDGAEWRVRPAVPAFDHVEVRSVAASVDRIVAVGQIDNVPESSAHVALISADGTTWTRTQTPVAFGVLAALSDRFVAAADAPGQVGSEIWTSADGADWTKVVPAGAVNGRVRQLRVVGLGDRPVLIGVGSTAGATHAAIWTASKASLNDWRRIVPELGGSVVLMDVASSRDRLLAVGNHLECCQVAAWGSDDATTWSSLGELVMEPATWPTSVVGVPNGFLVTGERVGQVSQIRAWTTAPGGEMWKGIPKDDIGIGDAEPQTSYSVVRLDGAVIVVGAIVADEPIITPFAWVVR